MPLTAFYIEESDGTVRATTDVVEWGRFMATDPMKRLIASERVGDYLVSTAFVGLRRFAFAMSRSLSPPADPLVYQTTVFPELPNECPFYDTYDYATRKQAQRGHKRIVALLWRELRKNGIPPSPHTNARRDT